MPDLHHLVQFGEALIVVQDQSANRHIFLTLRQVEVEQLIHLVNLKTCRQQILMIAYLLGGIVGIIVFILDITKDLLHDILEGDDTASTTELIHHDTQ